MRYSLLWSLIILLIIPLYQCTETTEDPTVPGSSDHSTFDIIQEEIFDKNCVTCHQPGTSFAKQSNLILTEGDSYNQLADRLPSNEAARNDNLLLVGTQGLQSLYTSFLWEKINFPDYAHFYEDHPDYGELMPLGGQALTNGELRFISEWIIAGAPDKGVVADVTLLEDTERFQIPSEEFSRLDPPPNGFQMNVGPFDIMPQSEREFVYFHEFNNSEDLYVNRVEVAMREGSHHFILYDYPGGEKHPPGEYRDYYYDDGSFNAETLVSIINSRFVYGTQWRNTDYQFPPGVAMRIPVGAGFDMNSHYVNYTDEVKQGEVFVNFHQVDKSEVQNVAQNLFESYQDFVLPANQVTTLERKSIFNERMHIFQLTSHAHRHMTEFEIYIDGGDRSGELVYYTNDWEHPPLVEFDPPIVLEPGEGLKARATYNNDSNKSLRFGLLSEDEMMIIFGAFYTE